MQNLIANLGYGVRLFAKAPGFTLLAVVRMVLREGMALVAAGIALGLVLALAFSRALATLLFGVSPTDSASYATGSAVLLAVAVVACYVPARRGDPDRSPSRL